LFVFIVDILLRL